LDRHYKIRPSTDHRAKFQAGRPTHLRDLMLGKKIKKNIMRKTFSSPLHKLSLSGGLIKTPYFGSLGLLKNINVDTTEKLVTSAYCDKQHAHAYLQPFS